MDRDQIQDRLGKVLDIWHDILQRYMNKIQDFLLFRNASEDVQIPILNLVLSTKHSNPLA